METRKSKKDDPKAPSPSDLDNESSTSTVAQPNSPKGDIVKVMMHMTMAMAEERREEGWKL